MRRLVLLRPEPGLSASRARAEALGLDVVSQPLFEIQPIAAEIPDGPFDALVLTSANAVRSGGRLLAALAGLPAYAVGQATAAALRDAGIHPVAVGTGGVDGLDLPSGRLLHLTGETHRQVPGEEVVSVSVYRTVALDRSLDDFTGAVVAVHSPRAGSRLSELATSGRSAATIAAISSAAAAACGSGWQSVHSATSPDDPALLALAAALCQSAAP